MWFISVDVDRDHLIEVVFVRLLQWNYSPHPPHTVLLEGSICAEPRLREWEYASPPGGQSMYITYLEFFCKGNVSFLLSLFIYSIIYLNQYALMDICFLFWVIIQHCYIDRIVPALALGTLAAGSYVPLTYLHHCSCSIFSISLISDTTRFSKLILYISCLNPRISHFSKKLCSFHRRMDLETKI